MYLLVEANENSGPATRPTAPYHPNPATAHRNASSHNNAHHCESHHECKK